MKESQNKSSEGKKRKIKLFINDEENIKDLKELNKN